MRIHCAEQLLVLIAPPCVMDEDIDGGIHLAARLAGG